MFDPIHIPGMLDDYWKEATFAPFRDGVEISRLHDGPPAVALLRYAPGASIPAHVHRGLETILVLDGSQSDERGTYSAGSLVLNPEGTSHRVWTRDGCVVLIQWTLPVEFLNLGSQT